MIKSQVFSKRWGSMVLASLSLDSQDRPKAWMPLIASLGRREGAQRWRRLKHLGVVGTEGMRAFGFQGEVARFLEAGYRQQSGILGSSPLVMLMVGFPV